MPKVSESIHAFLQARKTPANADLVDRWSIALETQINVAADGGEPVAGKRSTYSDGIRSWHSLRIPKDAYSEPSWRDYNLSFSIAEHAEGIGLTGWDWQAQRSRWVAFDFDDLTSHAKGVGLSPDELEQVKQAAMKLPYVECRRSTGGGGIHLYSYFDAAGIPCENHTIHAALARCILGRMSSDTGFDFASQIDCCGGVMWLWHRKMSPENQGLTRIKPATKLLSETDLPANWHEHIEVVTRKRTKVRVNEIAEDDLDPFEALASSRKIIPLDDNHRKQIEALQRSGFTTLWIDDHHLLQTHTYALKKLMEGEGKELNLIGSFETNSEGRNPGNPNCLHGETMVITREGSKPIRDLVDTTTTILTAGGKWINAPFKSFGTQQLLKITLQQQRSIKTIKATPDHGWFVAGKVQSNLQTGRAKFQYQHRVETQNLQVGDKLVQVFASPRAKLTPSIVGIQHGLVWGDGNAKKQTGKSSPPVCRLCLFGKKDAAILPYFNLHPQQPIRTKAGIPGIQITNLPGHFKSLVDLKCDKPYLYGWLAGYFAADGHVSKIGCCIIRSHNKQSIQHVRDVCNLLGISTSHIREGKSGKSSYKPGTPVFTTLLKRAHLTENFFLIHEHRRRYLTAGPAKYCAWTVKSIEPIEPEEVFCCTVPETGCFVLEDNILTSNCFLFPLLNGGWRVFRFSPGVAEADTWSQDGQGWTTCYFNRMPDLATVAKAHGGMEDPDNTGYTFRTPDDAVQVAKILGQDDIKLDPAFADRRTVLKAHKDGRMVVEIERKKGDNELQPPEGWLAKKTKWVRIFETTISDKKESDDLGLTEYDNFIRAIETSAKQFVGWNIQKNKEWVWQPAANIKMVLQNLGNAKDAAECIMGGAVSKGWRLVNLPFREEYPGGRQWNLDAAQFVYQPAALEPDQTPIHPHWDMIFEHIGVELTPALHNLPWAQKANIRTGADYLKAWVACAFREPFEPLPYLFLWGNEGSGKSILHEALSFLVTKGVVQADKALTSNNEFNGELAGAIICAVEEKDITLTAGAYARIKALTTAKTISIRQMRRDVYQVPNTTHWIQTSNRQGACPVMSGDTRITVIEVGDLLTESEVPKPLMEVKLREEAPHFMYTLLNLPLPPSITRLRLPMVATASKTATEELNQTSLQKFIHDYCQIKRGAQSLNFNEFYDGFQKVLEMGEKHLWSKIKVRRELPNRHRVIEGHGHERYVQDLIFKGPPEAGAC